MRATVVVSCYKQQHYIEECLESILSQQTDFDFNILVSDDCSPDDTPKILQSYKEKYPGKIYLLLRKKNVGPALNYIEAHNLAQGDIVFHIDGDDVMLPGKLQEQFNFFKNDDSVNLVFHRAQYFSDDLSRVGETGKPYQLDKYFMSFNARDLALWGSITVHSAYAYRRSSRKIRNLDREFMEWFFAMDSLLPTGTAIYIDKVLVRYRSNPNSGAYLSSRNGKIKAYSLNFADIEYYYLRYPEFRIRLYANYFFTVLAMCRAKCGVLKKSLYFIVKHFSKFRIGLLLAVFKMRKSVKPIINQQFFKILAVIILNSYKNALY